jgi:hypothetical protein
MVALAVVGMGVGIGIGGLHHRRSTCNPPHEQLLMRLGAGGALSSFICHLYVHHSSVVCTSVVRLPIIHPLFICLLFIHRVIHTLFVDVCPLSFHPGSTPQAVAREAGGGWYVIVCHLSYFSGGAWQVTRCIGCIPRGYPLQGSPSVPLCPPRPCRHPI